MTLSPLKERTRPGEEGMGSRLEPVPVAATRAAAPAGAFGPVRVSEPELLGDPAEAEEILDLFI